MKKNVNIRIKEIWHNNIDEEFFDLPLDEESEDFCVELLSQMIQPIGTPQVEFTTCGVLEKRRDGISITYEESELTGMQGAVTQFFISKDGSVSMTRSGDFPLNLVFEKDKNYICPGDDGPALVTTRELRNSISENGGSLDISYTVNVGGSTTEQNEFNIDII